MSDTPDLPSHIPTNSAFVAIILSGIWGWLPAILNIIAGTAAFIWFVICIKESRTYQHWIRNRAMKRNSRRLMKLKAREKIVIAKIEAAEKMRQARVAARDLIDHEIAEAAKLVAANNIVSKAEVIVQQESDKEHEEAKLP